MRELVELVNSGIQPLQNLSVLLHVSSLGADAQAWARHFVLNGLLALEQRAHTTRGAFLFGDQPTLADVCLVPQMFNAPLGLPQRPEFVGESTRSAKPCPAGPMPTRAPSRTRRRA
ncbi:MAG: glutathione S-transferase C-terminal domain-containing protein [Sandaracinaceae bacterium]|nr:glutathione S-transferase C-terminal domain-containing protein [Sandaracinaceae bacterium]